MAACRRFSPLQRRLLMALFACALLVRALVPGGWMVMPAADGVGAAIVPCSGMMPAAMQPDEAMAAGMHHSGSGDRADHPRPDHPQPDHPQPDHPCAFAGAALALAVPVFAAVPPLSALRVVPVPARRPAAVPGRGLAAPPPPAIGPPAFV